MQPISDDMVTMSKICVIVAKCERALINLIKHEVDMRDILGSHYTFTRIFDSIFDK